MTSLEEKRKTAQNKQAKDKGGILEARIIANYGDPGLAEDNHFDILSRYVIVMLESVYRIPTTDKWLNILAVVQRPRHLWIQTAGGVAATAASQKRSDAQGNVNVGLAANFSINGIQPLNTTYTMGEVIKIKRLPIPYTTSSYPAFFQTDFNVWNDTLFTYNPWHSEGSTLPYISNDATKVASLREKTIEPVVGANPNWYFDFYLNKLQYEVFMLTLADAAYVANLTRVFQGQWNGGTPVYTNHGGYLFGSVNTHGYVLLSSCQYEDMNVGNKMRIGGNDCIPLVVTTPNSFPTPKTRAVGTIAYNPSYSPIAR